MKRLVILIVFALVWAGADAQGIARMKESLARPGGVTGASVVVKETSDAAAAISAADRNGRASKMSCYHISLFRDNSQSAGANARAVADKFKELYPDVSVELKYESPYFTVQAANFLDHLDAVAMCGKVIAQFPKSVVVRSEMAVSSVIARQKSNFSKPASEIIRKEVVN